MSFRIVKDATSWWPVRWDGVAEDGSIVEQSVEVRFARMGRAEFVAMFGDGNETKNDAMFDRTVRDWRGVEDEDGAALAMTGEAVAALLDTANFPGALVDAYVAFWRALPETRLGNSSPPPAGGPAAAAATGAPEATPPA